MNLLYYEIPDLGRIPNSASSASLFFCSSSFFFSEKFSQKSVSALAWIGMRSSLVKVSLPDSSKTFWKWLSAGPEEMKKWQQEIDNGTAFLKDRLVQVRAQIQTDIDSLNEGLNRWETIKKFTLLEEDLTIDAGMLTPSLKLRRRAVADKYSDRIESMYQ